MGTLREDILYTSSHSDPDYTSSSEQSCDTVIYVGASGQSLSDRELTDHEGPPRSVPRTNPRLPRRPGGSRSSGDEGSNSDSGRSHHSDFRIRKPNMGTSVEGANLVRLPSRMSTPVRELSASGNEHAQSPPMSPSIGGVQLPRKANIRAKLVQKPEDGSANKVDKVTLSSRTAAMSAKIASGSEQAFRSEQWVDGPGVAIYPDQSKPGEQWVDGPQAFVIKPEQNKNKHLYNPKMNAEEQWVDGPREMMQDSDHKDGRKASGHSRTERKSHSREHSREHSVEPKGSSPSHVPKSGVKVKHPAACELKERPDSMASADSGASVAVQASDSRPTSMHSTTADAEHVVKTDESGQPIKPFVRDWIEKHSALKAEGKMEDISVGLIVDSDNQVIGNLETSATGTYKRPKPEARKKIRSSTPKQSPHHSPRNSPAIGRKSTKNESVPKLQKSQLPGNANPTHRVTEWLRSVSMEQEMEVETQGHSSTKKRVQDTEHNTSMDVSSCSSLQDTTMESQDLNNQSQCSAEGQPDEMAECNIADISFDSSVDTTEFSNMLLSNRESIYEIQMDEQLERSAEKSTSDVPDDETFSSASCNKDNELTEGEDGEEGMEDEPLLLRSDGIPHSSTVESIKTLLAEPVSSEQLVCEKLCSFECKSFDLQDQDIPCGSMDRPLLRKPDGASNPNLINELNFERKLDSDFIRGDYIINTVHSITSASQPRMDLDAKPIKNTTSKYASLPKHSEALTKALEGLCESKRCMKSKPPLPSKPLSKSSVHSPSPSRQSPTKSGGVKEKDVSTSPKSVSSTSSKNSSIPMGGAGRGRVDKEKSVRLQSSPSSSSSQRSSSVPVTSSPSSTSTIRSTSSKSSKSQSPISSRLPIFSSSKNTSRKGGKESKGSKLGNGRISELNRSSSRGTDSDSGNDSGIVTNEKKLLSPYSTVTKPRTPSHSSSGHGSDNSSTVSAELRSQLGCKSDKIHGGTSSGYESMLRDSEATGSSSAHEDSNSESSNEKKKGSRRKRPSKYFHNNPYIFYFILSGMVNSLELALLLF